MAVIRRWHLVGGAIGILGLVGALLAGQAFVDARRAVEGEPSPKRPPPPTIVLILTDDQRWDTLSAMATVRERLVGPGVTFVNSFVVDPLCCPSRAATLTGRYPHDTGVWRNDGPNGGFAAFHDGSTVATWLQARGYHTALFGKYLNRYEDTTYVPPGWTHWEAFDGSAVRGAFYQRYRLNVDGTIRRFGTKPGDYSTDVLAERAASYIVRTPGPLFVYVAPSAPHRPATPARRDAGAFDDLPPWRPPSYNEADMSDKPAWVRSRPRLGPSRRAAADRLRRRMLASLLPVDRAVGTILDALQASGRLHDSLVVFTSDNGFSWGEHRWTSKVAPWEENIRVPLVVRFDRVVSTPRSDPHLVLNIDLPSTFADAAGAGSPGAEGSSLMPLLRGTAAGWRTAFGIESAKGAGEGVPPYCGVRTARYAFVAYATGDRELYDLRGDPFELENAVGEPRMRSVVARLQADVRRLCRPPPPGSPPGFPP